MKKEKKKIKEIDDQLRRTTTFLIIGKEELKKEINKMIDKRFEFLEKDLKKSNEAIKWLKENL